MNAVAAETFNPIGPHIMVEALMAQLPKRTTTKADSSSSSSVQFLSGLAGGALEHIQTRAGDNREWRSRQRDAWKEEQRFTRPSRR